MFRLLAVLLVGFSAACCETTWQEVVTVPMISSTEFLKTDLFKRAPSTGDNPGGRIVNVICPPKGSEPVPFRGGEGLYQILGNAKILEVSALREWTNVAVIRFFPAGTEGAGHRSPVFVVLVDAHALFIKMNMDESIPIWLGDVIVVPADGEDVQDKLATEFGYRLQVANPNALDRLARLAPPRGAD